MEAATFLGVSRLLLENWINQEVHQDRYEKEKELRKRWSFSCGGFVASSLCRDLCQSCTTQVFDDTNQ